MSVDVNDVYWHDSEVKNIIINREDPGNIDTIKFEVDWWESGNKGALIFEKVYFIKMELNMGMHVNEMLDTVTIDNNDADFIKHEKINGGYEPNTNCYVIKMLTTGSDIKVIAAKIVVID
ncbi:hypothetical protein [Chitinophaga sp. RAB17]|uniref:hypothetical protein n=1 Tax=Chitinophaga sp. RAB17 TaxID=3233049 RepID=UPI003F8EBC95